MTGLLGMIILVGMGEHMAERFLPLYLQQLAQASTAVLAIGLLAVPRTETPCLCMKSRFKLEDCTR